MSARVRLTNREKEVLLKLTEAIFPPLEGDELDLRRTSFLDCCQTLLAAFDSEMRQQFRYALRLFELSAHAFAFSTRSFARLPLEQRLRYVESWEKSELYPRRAAFLALKSVCGMAYCSLPEVEQRLGYEPCCLHEHYEHLPEAERQQWLDRLRS